MTMKSRSTYRYSMTLLLMFIGVVVTVPKILQTYHEAGGSLVKEKMIINIDALVGQDPSREWARVLSESEIGKLARVYPKWQNDNSSWCPFSTAESPRIYPSQSGILFVKSHKAASSTGAGISLRIAHKVAERKFGNANSTCPHEYAHGFATRKHHANRYANRSYLWTNVRHPAKTALSAFFFFSVSRSGRPATSEAIILALSRRKSRQTDYLSTIERPKNLTRQGTLDWMQEFVMTPYNFMTVVERMDESLVVLKLLLGLELGDVVVLPSKQSGGYYMGGTEPRRCVTLVPPFTTPQVDYYIDQDFSNDNLDYWLHSVANRSLDLTIDALGRDLVNENVFGLHELQRLAELQCQSRAKFPCARDGTKQSEAASKSCYAEDCGCGYECVDEVLAKQESNK